MKKRFLAMLLALVMCVGLTIPAMAYDFDNGKCTYELSNEIIGTVELSYPNYETDELEAMTAYVVPDNTTVIPKNAPGARMASSNYIFGDWVAGGPIYEAGEPLVVEPSMGQDVEDSWWAYAVWTEDTSAEGYDPSPDAMPVAYLDMDEEKEGNGAFRVISESAAKALGLTIQPYTPGTAPAAPDQSGTAYASTQNVLVDGKAVEFQAYALKDQSGNDTNYVKLRDVAYALNGTAAQFSVGWDQAAKSISVTSGEAYEPNGSEMKTPYSGNRAYTASTSPLYINGKAADLGAILLNDDAGSGYTYFKLRDLGDALGFKVDWSAEKGIFIETN